MENALKNNNRIFFNKFKKVLIVMLLVPYLSFNLNLKKAEAVAVVDDAIIITGIAVTCVAVVGILYVNADKMGFSLENSDGTELTFGQKAMITLALATEVKDSVLDMANYVKIQYDKSNQMFLSLTEQGSSWCRSLFQKLMQDGMSVKYDLAKSFESTEGLTVPSGHTVALCPYYKGTDVLGTFKANTPIEFATGYDYRETGGEFKILNTKSKTFEKDVELRFIYSEMTPDSYTQNFKIILEYRYLDETNWRTLESCSYYTRHPYNNKTATDYGLISFCLGATLPTQVIDTGIEGDIGKDQSIAIQLEPDVIGEQEIYTTGIDGASDGAINYPATIYTDYIQDGLSDTRVGDGAIDETIEGAEGGILDRIGDIIKSIENVGDKVSDNTIDLDVPKENTPTLDFSPLMIATTKFPFCIPWDMYSSIKIFESNAEPFRYEFKEVKYSNTDIIIIPNFTVDFSTIPHIDVLLSVFKIIQYLLFVVFLISKIRSFMRS